MKQANQTDFIFYIVEMVNTYKAKNTVSQLLFNIYQTIYVSLPLFALLFKRNIGKIHPKKIALRYVSQAHKTGQQQLGKKSQNDIDFHFASYTTICIVHIIKWAISAVLKAIAYIHFNIFPKRLSLLFDKPVLLILSTIIFEEKTQICVYCVIHCTVYTQSARISVECIEWASCIDSFGKQSMLNLYFVVFYFFRMFHRENQKQAKRNDWWCVCNLCSCVLPLVNVVVVVVVKHTLANIVCVATLQQGSEQADKSKKKTFLIYEQEDIGKAQKMVTLNEQHTHHIGTNTIEQKWTTKWSA